MIFKNCKWKREIAENLRMLGQRWNSTEIWNSEEFLYWHPILGCWIRPANVTGQEKSGCVMGENKLSLESATKYIDSGN